MADAHAQPNHDYHLVNPSPWPVIGAVAAFTLAVGAIMTMKGLTVGGRTLGPYVLGVDGGATKTLAAVLDMRDGAPHLVVRRIRGPGIAEPFVPDDANADATRLGEGHPLDLAAEGAHLGPALLLCVGLDLLALGRRPERDLHEVAELRHRCLRR